MFPRIPTFAPPTETETRYQVGQRALSYVMAHGLPGLLETEALELANTVSLIAVRAREMSDPVRERIQQARTLINNVIAQRVRERIDADAFTAFVASVPRAPGGGLTVPAPAPKPRKPSPAGALPMHLPTTVNPF